jgi:hypothetical protein
MAVARSDNLKGETSMLRNFIRAGSCGLGLVVLAGMAGCAAQPQTNFDSVTLGASGTEGPAPTALVNQGRFPAPIYTQEAQPTYALTGNPASDAGWPSLGNYYEVGNARIILPPSP